MSNNGGKAVEEAPTARKVGSEVRLKPEEKAPPQIWAQQGSPSPLAHRLQRAASGARQLRMVQGKGGKSATEVGV